VIIYGRLEIIRVRTQTTDRSSVLGICGACLLELYQGRMRVVEQLATRELAMICSIGDDVQSVGIPPKRRARPGDEALLQFVAWNRAIQELGLKTQNYDKGLDRFVWKFKADEEMSSTVAVARGHHQDTDRPSVPHRERDGVYYWIRCMDTQTMKRCGQRCPHWRLSSRGTISHFRNQVNCIIRTSFHTCWRSTGTFLPDLSDHPDLSSE
jgi:hypothetical protein